MVIARITDPHQSGGLIGGVAGGIDAVKYSRKFWSGDYYTDSREYYMTSDGHPILKSRYDKFQDKMKTGNYSKGDYTYDVYVSMTKRINNNISFFELDTGTRTFNFGKGVDVNRIRYSYRGYIPEGKHVLMNQYTNKGSFTSKISKTPGWKFTSSKYLMRNINSLTISRSSPISLAEGIGKSCFSFRVLATIRP